MFFLGRYSITEINSISISNILIALSTGVRGFMGFILLGGISICFFMGVFGVPKYTIQLLLTLSRLRKIDKHGVVAENEIDRCFSGESERIMEILAKSKKGNDCMVYGNFKIPIFNSQSQLKGVSKKEDVWVFEQKRVPIAVSENIDKLVQKLPNDWIVPLKISLISQNGIET
jgi:hypothetical protein